MPSTKNNTRIAIASLAASAALIVSLVTSEDYVEKAAPPVAGDVPTYGFGTTTHPDGTPVKTGETTTPVKALQRMYLDVQQKESAIKQCVRVPLYQHEYDAYLSLSYNIGAKAFCNSTLVKRLNLQDYSGACSEILRWDRFKGKPLKGLTVRRQKEYQQCLGI